MGKMKKSSREPEETKLLYKKSNNTICTHSRTCSGVSQLYSRSAVLQIRKNLQETSNYYTEGGKIRRDLSLETDICVLRRYYKNKRYKTSTYESSAKSKYSTVLDTEVETIEEFPDTSACGDNEQGHVASNPNLDVGILMIENLKELISKWFQKHVFDNKKNRETIDIVLKTLLSQLDQISNGASSHSTYILHHETIDSYVKDKKIDADSFTMSRQKSFHIRTGNIDIIHNDSSSLPIPFLQNDIRMISTLSIPRHYYKNLIHHKENKQRNSLNKIKKRKRTDVILAYDRSHISMESSSFNLLDFSTVSRVKGLNYGVNSKHIPKKDIFHSTYKSATNNTTNTESEKKPQLNKFERNEKYETDISSLLKSIYTDDPANVTNIDKNKLCETFTMTDGILDVPKHIVNSNEITNYKPIGNLPKTKKPSLTIGFINNNVEFPNMSKPKDVYMTIPTNTLRINPLKVKYTNKPKIGNKKRVHRKIRNKNKLYSIQNKQFTFLFKKANSHLRQGNDFLKHCRSIFEYFVNYGGNRNIKLDIHINVVPLFDTTKIDASTITSESKLNMFKVQKGPTLMLNVEPVKNIPISKNSIKVEGVHQNFSSSSSDTNNKIITLLDGAASHSKYIFDTLKNTSEFTSVNVDRGTITSEIQIVQEICELKSIIKDLILTAEKLVNENVNRSLAGSSVHTETHISQITKDLTNLSKGIQCSNYKAKNPLISGLKLTKEPKKKDIIDFCHRLTKKSTSYRIIESESILRVTDMTLNNNDEKITDDILSLQKSKSLFELTTERNKRKLMAFFCDGGYVSPDSHTIDDCFDSETCANRWRLFNNKTLLENVENASGPSFQCPSYIPPISREDCDYCSTAYSQDPEAYRHEEPRKGMRFGEGCFYCMLLWIPIIIILGLFYVYVIKEWLKGDEKPKRTIVVKLADLGFK